MGYYKIKNITNSLGKRHINKDTSLKIEYFDGFQKKMYDLKVGQEIVISCSLLPVQIQKLRTKGFITIKDISESEYIKLQKPKTGNVKADIVSNNEEINDSEDNFSDKRKKKKQQKTPTIFITKND